MGLRAFKWWWTIYFWYEFNINLKQWKTYVDESDGVFYIWENFYDEKECLNTYSVNFFKEVGCLYDRFYEEDIQKAYETDYIIDKLKEIGYNVKTFDDYSNRVDLAKCSRLTFVAGR